MILSATLTKPGPRKINEDSIGVWQNIETFFAAIADGLGGMGGGSDASRMAVEYIGEHLPKIEMSISALTSLASDIHSQILETQAAHPKLRSMATTLTAVSIVRMQLIGIHCGDTRAAIARGEGIMRLTEDHAEGARLFRTGKLSREEFDDYPRKHILDSALGVQGTPQIDSFRFSIEPGDKVFLTTDGVHQTVLLRELQQIARKYIDPVEFVAEIDRLVEKRGATDNYSMVAIFIR